VGYLPVEAIAGSRASSAYRNPPVFGVATFYAQFKFVPMGRNVIKVCRAPAATSKAPPGY